MSVVSPASALVRPRVTLRDFGGTRPLEDVVSEIADEVAFGVVWVFGGPGSGKSTALSHLAAVFSGDTRFQFIDEPSNTELDSCIDSSLVVATTASSVARGGIVLRLATWDGDDLAGYLLAKHPERCRSVFARLGRAAQMNWNPELACVVLEQFCQDQTVSEPSAAIQAEIQTRLPQRSHRVIAAEYCLTVLMGDVAACKSVAKSLDRIGCPSNARSLLRHAGVQLPLAADRLVNCLSSSKSARMLKQKLPADLIELVAIRCGNVARAKEHLRKLLALPEESASHPMAVSILALADKHWQPTHNSSHPWCFREACLRGVDWSRVELANADLGKADFSDASLAHANLEQGQLGGTVFQRANLTSARLVGADAAQADFSCAKLAKSKMSLGDFIRASFNGADLSNAAIVKANLTSADFSEANLTRADFCGARLRGACFDGTDLTSAQFDDADLAQVDLRTAILHATTFSGANLKHAKLDDICFPQARMRGVQLEHAHLTGSMLPDADLRHAMLSYARLAEVHWEGADLRDADFCGASFHMGSSRSGLVGSPIACEGSKTGFYTDDREELYFKRPEEIRKANLRRVDLRGANVTGVDFYLVDLRDAKLDPDQQLLARKTGAILDEWEN